MTQRFTAGTNLKFRLPLFLTVGLWLCLPLSTTSAHVYHACLKAVEQAARDFKACTNQSRAEHCRKQRQHLSQQVNQCKAQAFAEEDIVDAIRHGESEIAGDPAYYLPSTGQADQQQGNDITQGNIENFREQFTNVSAFPVEDLGFGANMGGCNRAFLTKGKRYQFLGEFDFKRYTGKDLKAVPHHLFFFARMTDGACYAAPRPGQTMDNGDLVVVNLPESFFPFLKQSSRVAGATAVIVECVNEKACFDKKRRAIELQVDYHATYLRLTRLQQCEEMAKDNQILHRMAKFRFTSKEIPTYCMEENLAENLRSLRDTLEDIGKQLFEAL